ncbi:MAG: PorT family protein [Bacteroidales bacterium]|nr:PorT family protein [Bacteroidales bacterium]
MKKYILTVLAAMIMATGMADARKIDKAHHFRIGPKVGLTGGWIPGSVLLSNEKVIPHMSYYAGISADYNLNEHFLIQADVLYTGKGHSDRTNSLAYSDYLTSRYNLELGFVDVPLYLVYRISDNGLEFKLGPEFNFNVVAYDKFSEDVNIKSDSYDPEAGNKFETIKTDRRSYVRPFNVGISAGISYEFFQGFAFDFRFSYDFMGIIKPSLVDEINNEIISGSESGKRFSDKSRMMTISLGFVYKFEL